MSKFTKKGESEAVSASDIESRLGEETPDYHVNLASGVTSSMLKCFRDSIGGFHAKYVLRESVEEKRSKALEYGSAFHAWMLERDLFDLRVAVQPNVKRTTVKNKEIWSEFEMAHAGKAWIDEKDLALIKAMEIAILNDAEAAKWMTEFDSINERTIAWQSRVAVMDDQLIKMKCKPDRLILDSRNGGEVGSDVIVDLKTTTDTTPEGISRSAWNYGYHCQAALYCDGVMAINGGEPVRHVSVFVNKTYPHEVASVEYTPEALAMGREMNEEALREMADCMAYDAWNSRTANRLTPVDLPGWAYSSRQKAKNILYGNPKAVAAKPL